VATDWSERNGPIKGKQRTDSEDRTIEYRAWRHTLGNGLYAADIDQVEWRVRDGVPVPVAVLELSRVDGNVRVPPAYLEAVVDRMTRRDGQASAVTHFASLLGVKAWVVLFRWDLTEYWVYNLSTPRDRWWHLAPDKYRDWLVSL
jgi:hypothetical protein